MKISFPFFLLILLGGCVSPSSEQVSAGKLEMNETRPFLDIPLPRGLEHYSREGFLRLRDRTAILLYRGNVSWARLHEFFDYYLPVSNWRRIRMIQVGGEERIVYRKDEEHLVLVVRPPSKGGGIEVVMELNIYNERTR